MFVTAQSVNTAHYAWLAYTHWRPFYETCRSRSSLLSLGLSLSPNAIQLLRYPVYDLGYAESAWRQIQTVQILIILV